MNQPSNAPLPASSIDESRWFSEEVRPHESALRGYLRHRFPSIDTDDVVQESYVKILKARAVGRIAHTKAYLFSIARNTAINLFRRETIYAPTPVNELPSWRVLDGGPDAAEITNRSQRFELIMEAMETLPLRCRAVVRLAVLRGLPNVEIARQLGVSESTVRVQLGRAVRKCAAYLCERGEGQ